MTKMELAIKEHNKHANQMGWEKISLALLSYKTGFTPERLLNWNRKIESFDNTNRIIEYLDYCIMPNDL